MLEVKHYPVSVFQTIVLQNYEKLLCFFEHHISQIFSDLTEGSLKKNSAFNPQKRDKQEWGGREQGVPFMWIKKNPYHYRL